MKKTIGILAHVDAGKTTFSEQVLFNTKAIRSKGRVDHKDAFLDNNEIEKERGITVFSEGAVFNIGDNSYYLVDTPGHVDFSCEMERAIESLDAAIIIISGVEGIQGHTETVWHLLRQYHKPVFFFINKCDRESYDRGKVLAEIRSTFTKDAIFLEEDYLNNEEVSEFIAERDEDLLEKYFEVNVSKEELLETLSKEVMSLKAFPCMEGSALQDIGINEFLKIFDELTFTDYKKESEVFSGRIYKISHDEKGNKLTFIKALEGTLKTKEEINIGSKCEKINELRIYNGSKYKTVDKIEAGDNFAAVNLSMGKCGEGIGILKDSKLIFKIVPTLMSSVLFPKDKNPKEVLKIFRILEEEDPALNVQYSEALKEIQISIMGKIQLEVLKEVVKRRFNLEVDFGPCKILYKESIKGSVIGCGHFEPLRHYAEVHLKIEEGKRNSGITFESKAHTDNLSIGHQNLIKTHIFEREHNGVLTGSPLTDVKITLLTGREHIKHTSGGDFREATYRALRQGLEQAENILLEPYYNFRINVPAENIGRVLADIQKLSGEFEPAEIKEDRAEIRGRGPVKTFMDYSTEIIAFSKGKGSISLMYDGYDLCHNSEEVIQEINYNKEADIEYTSTSIFCSKGESYLVKWDKAKEHMHCEIV